MDPGRRAPPPARGATGDQRPAPPAVVGACLALFVVSGAGGLVFELVLLRHLALLLGSTAAAVAVVLAAFMGGLALGAAVVGRAADRVARPLRLYGWLELAVAASASLLVALLGPGRGLLERALSLLGPGRAATLAEYLLALALVLVPTVPMGGTLPVLGRLLIRGDTGYVRRLGLLYGANTLGGAAGVLVAGFWGFELAGVSATGWLAGAVLAATGAAALALDRWLDGGRRSRSPADTPAAPASPPAAPVALPAVRRVCLAAAAGGGFAVLGYEVAWTRLMSLFMRSYTYSFSLMLALFLAGLCLGAALLAAVAPRLRRPVLVLGWVQVAMGVWVASSLLWLPGWLAPVRADGFAAFMLAGAARAAWIVLPPTVLSGMALPLAARGAVRGGSRVGADVGAVYGANTAGAIAGALAGGLLLLPLAGTSGALAILASINAASGAAVLLVAGGRRPWRAAVAAVLAAGCLLPVTAGRQRWIDAFVGASVGGGDAGEVLLYREGATDTVAVVRKRYGFFDPDAKSLITNGVAMSATVQPVWRYMAAEGHLPVLLVPAPRRALAVGVGTGITLGAVVSHPGIEAITAVELSEGVIAGLDLFRQENAGAHRDARVRLVRGDGRYWLARTEERYDVITVEPPPPIVAGSVHLYSAEFYRLCRARLQPGGVVAQWLPLHGQSAESARMVARTFIDAFPHAMLWLPSIRDAVLVGSQQPFTSELERWLVAWDQPSTRRNLRRAMLETPEALLSTLWLDREGIAGWSGPAPAITDERPRMEFFRHQGGNMTDRDIASLLDLPPPDWGWLEGLLRLPGLRAAIEHEHRALRLYVRAGVAGDPAAAVEAARLARGTEFLLYPLGCATTQIERLAAGATELAAHESQARLASCAALRGGEP